MHAKITINTKKEKANKRKNEKREQKKRSENDEASDFEKNDLYSEDQRRNQAPVQTAAGTGTVIASQALG